MKRFLSRALSALLLLAAALPAGCSPAAPADPSEVTTQTTQSAPEASADTGEASLTPSAAGDTFPEDSSWSVVLNTEITHATNIAGFLSDASGITAGYGGEIHYTNDAGTTWPEGENSSKCLFCLDIVDEHLAWTGGNGNDVRMTGDGGKTWSEASDVDISGTLCSIDFIDDTTGWAASLSGLTATENGGGTWTEIALPEGAEGVAAICLRTQQDGYLLSRDGMLYTTADGGATWSGQDLELESYDIVDVQKRPKLSKNNQPVADISFTDENNGTIVLIGLSASGPGYKIWCLTTGDGGATWESELIPEAGFAPKKVYISSDGMYLTLGDYNNQTVLLKRKEG